jgi:hypothetical protein
MGATGVMSVILLASAQAKDWANCPDFESVDGCFDCKTDSSCRMRCQCCVDQAMSAACINSVITDPDEIGTDRRISECDLSLGCESVVNRGGYLTCADG